MYLAKFVWLNKQWHYIKTTINDWKGGSNIQTDREIVILEHCQHALKYNVILNHPKDYGQR